MCAGAILSVETGSSRHVSLRVVGAVLVLHVHAGAELLQLEPVPIHADLVSHAPGFFYGGALLFRHCQSPLRSVLAAIAASFPNKDGPLPPPVSGTTSHSSPREAVGRYRAQTRRRAQEGRRSRCLRSWALRATTIVERLIKTAPTAGESRIPMGASTPAARGMATTL
jgi:hypothetical protein